LIKAAAAHVLSGSARLFLKQKDDANKFAKRTGNIDCYQFRILLFGILERSRTNLKGGRLKLSYENKSRFY
jgi:hypothetical protein